MGPGIAQKPFLSQDHELDPSHFCSEEISTNGDFPPTINSSCYHILHADIGDVVDIFFINADDNMRHPIHLHGYHFRVLAEGKLEQPVDDDHNYVPEIKKLYTDGKINANYDHPVKKDTL